jgi:hypothetical protein
MKPKTEYIEWKDLSFQCYCGTAPKWAQIPYDIYEKVKHFFFPPWGNGGLWPVRYWLNPRQKWIKKYITYGSWCDKPELLTDFLFGCVQDFVDPNGENCFGVVGDSSPEHSKFAEELRQCHYYILVERPALQERIDRELSIASDRAGPMKWIDVEEGGIPMKEYVPPPIPYDELYGEHNKLEKKLDELDTKWLTWIVANRNWMWV